MTYTLDAGFMYRTAIHDEFDNLEDALNFYDECMDDPGCRGVYGVILRKDGEILEKWEIGNG